jgi:8-oxo-dGTP pyrophosphatase MutT (NUDIX family)
MPGIPGPAAARPRDAATLVLLRDGAAGLEVWLMRRAVTMAFAAGFVVFPGGRAEPGDTSLEHTAAREAAEECGVEVEPGALLPWARWITPEGEPRRYDTRFYVAGLPAGQDAEARGTEAVEAWWSTPARAVADWEARAHLLMPPTAVTLRQLARYATVAAVLAAAPPEMPGPLEPELVVDGDRVRIVLPGGVEVVW